MLRRVVNPVLDFYTFSIHFTLLSISRSIDAHLFFTVITFMKYIFVVKVYGKYIFTTTKHMYIYIFFFTDEKITLKIDLDN